MTERLQPVDELRALRRLADGQAALRRVATLVAHGVEPAEIFTAVSEEVERLFGGSAGVLRFEDDGPAIVVVGVSTSADVSIGTRWELDDRMASAEVYRTGESVQVDGTNWSATDGPVASARHRLGIVSAVAGPIVVEGRLWGTMNLWSAGGPLPRDAGERLENFADLVATAIANAESRETVRMLADEQSALRRVATLVAQGVPAADLFSAVSDEVGRVFGSDKATVVKFEHEPPAIVIVGIGRGLPGAILGVRSPLDAGMAGTQVYQTGRSARVDDRDWRSISGSLREAGEPLGLSSTVATPITVNDHVWGAITLVATQPQPLGTEARLAGFSELVGIAIASADAQEAVRLLADEQAALRRVATLVAQGVPAEEVFSAVSEEVARLFGEDLAAVGKFDPDGPAVTFVGLSKPVEGVEIGTRVGLSDETPAGLVYATGHPARVDRTDWSTASSPIGRLAGRSAIVSVVCSPIIVEGQLWGEISALSSTKPLPLETDRRLERFSELIATAIANAESSSELAASRRRIVAASDETRRRIERDLHDGTQQRLVSLALAVRATEADVPPELQGIRSELLRIATGLADANAELQAITRGIHPASLEQRGLGAALRTLARRSPIPVELDVVNDGRFPEPVEVAVYYVASEALANAAKHAQATGVEVSLVQRHDSMLLSICDNGIGGADPAQGSGLVGLADRVEALGGSLEVQSPTGHGTRITAMLPLDPESGAVLS